MAARLRAGLASVVVALVTTTCAAPPEPVRATSGLMPPGCREPTVAWAGTCVDPTGAQSATGAIGRALAGLPEPVGLGAVLELPANAILRLDDPDGDGVAVVVERRVIVEGRGARIDVEDGITAFRFSRGASWASVRDLRVVGPGPESSTVGIEVQCHGLRLDNLWLERLGQAVQAISRPRGGPCDNDDNCPDGSCVRGSCLLATLNANTQRWTNLIVRRCGGGIRLQGADANAGLLQGLEILSTPRAVQDESFLGNVYVGPTIASGREASLALGGSAQYSTVLGGYVERDGARVQTGPRTLLVGGNAVPYMDGPGERVGYRSSRLRFADLETQLRVDLPGRAGPLSWRHPDDAAGWELRRYPNPNGASWAFSWGSERVYLRPEVPRAHPVESATEPPGPVRAGGSLGPSTGR